MNSEASRRAPLSAGRSPLIQATLSYGLWPFVVAAGTCFTYLGIRSGHELALIFLAVNVGMLVVVVAAEQIVPRRREWNALTDRQTVNDLAHGFIESQIGERLGGVLFLTVAADAAAGLTTLVGRPLWPIEWPLIVQIVLIIAIGDGIDYWKHRLLHTVPWFWRLHALHHGITQLHAFRLRAIILSNC